MLLSIKNLKVSINNKEILKGVNLEVRAGEVHAIMGPNGCLLYTSPSPRDRQKSRMPSSA